MLACLHGKSNVGTVKTRVLTRDIMAATTKTGLRGGVCGDVLGERVGVRRNG